MNMRKGDETKSSILETALAEMSTLGLSGLSIGGLAKKVEMSKSGLFAHFSSKEELQLQVLHTASEVFVREVISPALRQPRGEPRVRALFENCLVWWKSSQIPGGCPFISASNELDDQPGLLRDYLVQAQQDWLDIITTAARIAVSEGQFREDLDAQQFAFEFYSISLGQHHFERLLHDPNSHERSLDAFEALLQRSRA